MPYNTCRSYTATAYISTNTTTAYSQGYAEAQAAFQAAVNLGFDMTGAPLIYDLESYNGGTTCRNAAKAFINGWVAYLHISPAQKAGVYGSACGSYLDDFSTITNVPDFIWFAWWNGNPSTSNITCISTSHWANHQRHKQYAGGHTETYGGVTINMDNDCSNGPVYLSANQYGSTCL